MGLSAFKGYMDRQKLSGDPASDPSMAFNGSTKYQGPMASRTGWSDGSVYTVSWKALIAARETKQGTRQQPGILRFMAVINALTQRIGIRDQCRTTNWYK